MVYLVKYGPADVKRRPRLLVAAYLPKVVEVDQDNVDLKLSGRIP
jgi:hypothetical protein